MIPDDFKQARKTQESQTQTKIDRDRLLEEVCRDRRSRTAAILWRDVREVGLSLLMIPLWIYLGIKCSMPWTWYLTVPALLWIAGYMIADRVSHKRQPLDPCEPLRQGVATSLAQVEQQIRLLKNVFWWYLLPLALSISAFFSQIAWQERSNGWWTFIGVSGSVAFGVLVFACVYRLNQYAVRSELEPRRRELEMLLMSFEDKAPDAT